MIGHKFKGQLINRVEKSQILVFRVLIGECECK